MLNSKIYKNYFPVKEIYTHFCDREKKVLSNWICTFRTEVKMREISEAQLGAFRVLTYNLYMFDEKIMLDMLAKNQFDNNYLIMLNIIIYRHKYNTILSCYFFPMMSKEKLKELNIKYENF